MFEQILKHRPKGATHWQAGYYYNSDECGIWSIWENGKWHGDFKFPDGVMTKLPEEKDPAMSEFKVGDRVVLVGTGTKDVLLEIVEHMYTPNMHRVKIIATGQYGPVFKNDIRHAKPEEIVAGHRIDNDMGDDFPIENRISPYCQSRDV